MMMLSKEHESPLKAWELLWLFSVRTELENILIGFSEDQPVLFKPLYVITMVTGHKQLLNFIWLAFETRRYFKINQNF